MAFGQVDTRTPLWSVRAKFKAIGAAPGFADPDAFAAKVELIADGVRKRGWKVQSFSFTGLRGVNFFPPGQDGSAVFVVGKLGGNKTQARDVVRAAATSLRVLVADLRDWIIIPLKAVPEVVETSAEAAKRLAEKGAGLGPTGDPCKDLVGVKCKTIAITGGVLVGAVALAAITGNIRRIVGG